MRGRRMIDLFADGVTISPSMASLDDALSDGATHGRIERAGLRMLRI